MAYNELISSGVTLNADAATTYSFSFDTPIAADGSPHITQMGFQIDAVMAAAITAQTGTLGKLITSLRVKVGANTIVDWDSPIAYAAGSNPASSVAQISVLAQSLGGEDYFWGEPNAVDKSILTGISFPVGLDASKSHRVNVTLGLDVVTDWYGGATGFASSEMNVELAYGIAKEATLVGAGQQFTMSAKAQRVVTIYGKQNWSMLGILVCNDSESDEITEIRANYGAFRALKPSQWRTIFGRSRRNPLRGLPAMTNEQNVAPTYLTQMQGTLFMDLRRLSAGASIDLSVYTTAGTDLRFYPVFVAPLGAQTARPPKQTAVNPQSTTQTVVTEDASQN